MSAASPRRVVDGKPAIEPGDQVTTPTGRTANVVFTYREAHEALVEWPDDTRATFQWRHLRRCE